MCTGRNRVASSRRRTRSAMCSGDAGRPHPSQGRQFGDAPIYVQHFTANCSGRGTGNSWMTNSMERRRSSPRPPRSSDEGRAVIGGGAPFDAQPCSLGVQVWIPAATLRHSQRRSLIWVNYFSWRDNFDATCLAYFGGNISVRG
jgi:hypothetical protein